MHPQIGQHITEFTHNQMVEAVANSGGDNEDILQTAKTMFLTAIICKEKGDYTKATKADPHCIGLRPDIV